MRRELQPQRKSLKLQRWRTHRPLQWDRLTVRLASERGKGRGRRRRWRPTTQRPPVRRDLQPQEKSLKLQKLRTNQHLQRDRLTAHLARRRGKGRGRRRRHHLTA